MNKVAAKPSQIKIFEFIQRPKTIYANITDVIIIAFTRKPLTGHAILNRIKIYASRNIQNKKFIKRTKVIIKEMILLFGTGTVGKNILIIIP